MKSLSIIIPNWNGIKQLKKNLPQLFKVLKTYPGNSEVVIIDDASSDKSPKILKFVISNSLKTSIYNKKITCRILCNKTNLGFAETVNRGVNIARHNIVFLLNTDVWVKNDCFERIVPHFKDRGVFAVGANHDWSFGIGNFIENPRDTNGLTEKVKPSARKLRPALWVCGGNAAFRRQTWLRLGGLSADLFYPFYFEETDLCYRAWKRGYQVVWDPRARVRHIHEEGVIRKNFKKNISILFSNEIN